MEEDKKEFKVSNFIDSVPEKFKAAASFLVESIPKEFKLVDAKFRERKKVRPGEWHYEFNTIVQDPKTKRSSISSFNANKLLRQILKEKKYGTKQRSKFTI